MADWPTTATQPGATYINSLGSETSGAYGITVSAASTVWPAANRALYIPFTVESFQTAFQMAFEVTTQSGNCDVGIYDINAVRLVSAGSTAVGAAGAQAVNITDTALVPGVYFMAMNVDNTTAAFRIGAPATQWLQVSGVQQQAVGAVALPDPATFANPASAYIPFLTVALRATI